MSRKPRFLIVTHDRYPPFRVDITILFSKYLKPRFVFEWLMIGKNEGVTGVREEGGETFRVLAPGGLQGAIDFAVGHAGRLFAVLLRRYDLVQCRDCIVIGALYAIAAQLGSRPFVYWMSFPIEDGYVDCGNELAKQRQFHSALPRWVIGFLGRHLLRYITLPLARHIFVQSERMRDVVAARYRVPLERMTPVPMGVDLGRLSPDHIAPAAHSFYEGRRVVLYLGGLHASREMAVPARGVALAMQQRSELVFVAIGTATDAERKCVRDIFEEEGVSDRLLFLNHLPLPEALSHVRRADVCLSPVPAIPLFEVSTPTKLCEYIAMGRRPVANHLPDHDRVISSTGLGILTSFEEQAFRDAILAALRLGEPSPHETARALAWLKANRDYRALSAKVGDVYDELLRRDQELPRQRESAATAP